MGVPTIISVAPAGGPTVGGQYVSIIGTNFVDADTTVTIGGVTATVNSVASDGNSLICTADAGIKDIVVTTGEGTATIVAVDTSVAAFNASTAASNRATAAANRATAAAAAASAVANDASDAVAALGDTVNVMMSELNNQLNALTNLVIKIDVLTIKCLTIPSTITLNIYPGNGQTVSSVYNDLLNGRITISMNDKTQQVTSSNVTKITSYLTCTFSVTSGEYNVIVVFGGTEVLNTFATVP